MGIRFSWVALVFGIAAATAVACGSSDSSQFGGPGSSSGDGSSGGDMSSSGTLGSSGTPPAQGPLTIDPPTATLTITSRTTPQTQTFAAKVGTSPVTAGWLLDSYATGAIDAKGVFTTTGIVGGKTKVKASYQMLAASADLLVNVKLSEDLATPASPANRGALDSPSPDPGGSNASQIVYPLDGTVMPRGLSAPAIQFSAGSIPPQDAKLTLSCSTFSWTGYGSIATPANPEIDVPQDVWDAFTQSCGGEQATITVVKASGGMAYGPVSLKIIIAPTTLKGAVFYQTYDGAAGGPTFGLWSVKPGVKTPAKHLVSQCVVCHSVSANGATLVTGADPSVVGYSGAYKAQTDGSITQVSAAPTMLGGDTRGISFSFLTPDGAYAFRSTNNFWGGTATLAFKVDPAGTSTSQMAQATVNGLANVPAYVPNFSPDGKHIAFVNGDGATVGTARESVSTMDVAYDAAGTGTFTFSNQKVVIDNGLTGASGLVTHFPVFLPDSQQIVLQEGVGNVTGYGGMLAYYGPPGGQAVGNTGKLFMIRGGEHIELANANRNVVPGEESVNYEPTSLPVQAGGYFWIVFTSRRSYGTTYTGANVRKQLWVAAIDPTSPTGVDPSHAAFYLPNQTDTANDRGFWALEPCKANGASCETSDECCGGSCSPQDPTMPTSKTCGVPTAGACRMQDEKCDGSNPCCSGLNCVAGSCAPPTVN